MVSQATSINPALGNYNYQYPLTAAKNSSNNLLTGGTPVISDYSDDIMMSNLDFSNPANLQPITTQQTGAAPLPLTRQTQQPTSFTSNPAGQTPETSSELDGYLVQQDKNIAYTENGNSYKKSNSGKVLGAIAGFFAPLAGKVIDLFKGGSIKNLFKLKQLAIVCPAIALAGLGVGALVDGFTNSKKAQAADANASQPQAQTQQPQQTGTQTVNTLA